MTTEQTWTCQICGRAIKAKSRRIAHHGYTRPRYQGYQTASCLGAKYAPYEVSRDRLPFAIDGLTQYRDRVQKTLDDLVADPVAKVPKRGMYNSRLGTFDVTMEEPEGFKTYANYEAARKAYIASFERDLGWINEDLARLQARYDEWPGQK